MATHLGDRRHLGGDVHDVQRLCILRHGRQLAPCKQSLRMVLTSTLQLSSLQLWQLGKPLGPSQARPPAAGRGQILSVH